MSLHEWLTLTFFSITLIFLMFFPSIIMTYVYLYRCKIFNNRCDDRHKKILTTILGFLLMFTLFLNIIYEVTKSNNNRKLVYGNIVSIEQKEDLNLDLVIDVKGEYISRCVKITDNVFIGDNSNLVMFYELYNTKPIIVGRWYENLIYMLFPITKEMMNLDTLEFYEKSEINVYLDKNKYDIRVVEINE